MTHTTTTITLEIKVSDKVADLYPNYKFNWDNISEFTEHLATSLETPEDQGIHDYGYTIDVIDNQEADTNKLIADFVGTNQILSDKITEILEQNIGTFGYKDICLSSKDPEVKRKAIIEFIEHYNQWHTNPKNQI
tara:strand:+ start:220 stop:624 length:405 start_codon:yes stop_codon:yes gene_type:complete